MIHEEAIRAKEYFERRLREGSRNTTAQVINFLLAIEAIEKQIPKKPDYQINGLHKSYKYPNCGTFAIDEYCIHCGQHIDWRNE